MTEQELHIAIKTGDKEAFRHLFNTYYPYLCTYAAGILKNSDNAEEIVQEVFFKIWKDQLKLNIQVSFKSYLFQSVRNACMNYFKFRKVRISHAETISNELEHTNHPADDETDDHENLHAQLYAAIDRLPEERKKVFKMVKIEERKYKEVATALGISVKTVENQMGKALQFLRDELKRFIPAILLWLKLFFYLLIGVFIY